MLWYEHQCTTNLCPHRNCFIIRVNKYWPYYNVHRPLRNENGYSFAFISSTVFLSFHLLIFSSCRCFVALFNFISFLNKNISQSCIVFSLLVCHHMISVCFWTHSLSNRIFIRCDCCNVTSKLCRKFNCIFLFVHINLTQRTKKKTAHSYFMKFAYFLSRSVSIFGWSFQKVMTSKSINVFFYISL